MINDLLLLSGADIPFIEGTVTIHQPTIYEISLIGEEAFFTGCELLKFSKENLSSEDKNQLIYQEDFDILMSIMNDKSGSMNYNVSCAKLVLDLMFPMYIVEIAFGEIRFLDREYGVPCGRLSAMNYRAFREILIQMFALTKAGTASGDYNPEGDMAKKIAEKFQKRHQQLAKLSSDKTRRVAIFSRYISILTVGQQKDMNSFMKYTVYQLFDEFRRFELKQNYDVFVKARLAGASEMKEPEDWRKDIHTTGD